MLERITLINITGIVHVFQGENINPRKHERNTSNIILSESELCN